MEVAVSALRAELKQWIERARDGEEVVVTDRGLPVARLAGIGSADLIQGLVRDGLLTPSSVPRPVVGVPERRDQASRDRTPRDRVSGLVRRIRR